MPFLLLFALADGPAGPVLTGVLAGVWDFAAAALSAVFDFADEAGGSVRRRFERVPLPPLMLELPPCGFGVVAAGPDGDGEGGSNIDSGVGVPCCCGWRCSVDEEAGVLWDRRAPANVMAVLSLQ